MTSREPQAESSGGAQRVLGSLLAGALAGAATGLIDGLWSYAALSQYLPGATDKLGLLLHLALSYCFAGTALGLLIGLTRELLAGSQLSAFSAQLLRGIPKASDTENAARLSLVLAGLPLLFAASSLSYLMAHQSLVARKHPGLIIVSAIAICLVASLALVLATLIAGGLIERLLSRLQRLPSPGLVAAMLLGLLAGLAYVLWGKTLLGVGLQQIWICFAGLALAMATPLLAGKLVALLDGRAPAQRSAALPALHVLSGLPLLGLSLALSYKLASQGIGGKPALLVASAMGLCLVSLCLALLSTLLLARLLDASLGRLAVLRSARAPQRVALLLLALGLLIGALIWRDTLALLRLRPFSAALGMAFLATGTWPIGARLANRLSGTWPVSRPALAVPVLLVASTLLFAAIVLSGASESVRKAQVLHSGLGEPLAKIYRAVGDWDRDGYSQWLGGGDCDDFDPYVHPNADEIPGDGLDNNCIAGDVTRRSASATGFAEVPSSIPKDFNVLLITIDTIRADHLGAYGYSRNTTPNIDALAASGTLFSNGWAHAPSTRYSIPALLTGRHPLNVRYFDIPRQWPGLSESNQTIAELLKGRGLSTGAILNYWYFDEHRKMNQGFDHYDNKNKRLHRPVKGEGPAKTSGSSSKEQTDKALSYVAEHEAERFFLWVHYYDPHYDYERHEGVERFGDSKIDGYDHEIAYTDKHIGRLLDELEARGLDKKTVIVITGDHGEGFGEHGIDLHGYHLYAAQTKVPFIIKVPGVAPSVVQTPASHVDVLPTLANLSGAASEVDMLGRSLLGFITGSEDREQERYVFQQLSYENNNEYRAAVSAKCHVLYNVSPNLSWELYRIDTDPMEARDIIDQPGECAGARKALERWYDYSEIPEGAIEALLEAPPTLDEPISVRFGDSMELLQVEMPKTVKRGQSFTMELSWTASRRPPPGWKVFAHFEGPQGRFTGDHEPVRPFAWWKKGQHIRYQHRVSLPKHQRPGSYTLWFGVFKKNERMDVVAEQHEIKDNRVKLGSIEVLP